MTKEVKNQILKLRRLEKSYSEISEETGVSLGSVKSIISRNAIKPEVTEPCKCCGEPVLQVEGKKKREFCNNKCRAKYWRQVASKEKPEAKCLNCGAPFYSSVKPEKKFCSHKCYITFRYKKGGGC